MLIPCPLARVPSCQSSRTARRGCSADEELPMSDTVQEAFQWFQKWNIPEVSHVETFELYGAGVDGKVTVQLHDYGPAARPMYRYRAVVWGGGGRRRAGNGGGAVSIALAIVHLPEAS